MNSNIFKIDGCEELIKAEKKSSIDLTELVAYTSIWANPKVFDCLKKQNQFGVWYPNMRRARKTERKGEKINGVTLDDNTHARKSILFSTGIQQNNIKNYYACHVWAASCYDEKYHTCIANLVLIPAPLAGLTDFHPEIVDTLKYRAFELFNWYLGESPPTKFIKYPSLWKEPAEFSETVCQSLEKRLQKRID